jgi:hypothetical protein
MDSLVCQKEKALIHRDPELKGHIGRTIIQPLWTGMYLKQSMMNFIRI